MANPLLFRRQFLLGDRPLPIENWQHHTLHKQWVITAHPDLNIVISAKSSSILALIGYMLDAENPGYTDEQILKNIHYAHETIDSLVQKTQSLSGRWILLYVDADSAFIFNDAGGNRDVYYTEVEGVTWCGSQPHLLTENLGIPLSENEDIIRYFSKESVESLAFKWSTTFSAYKDVFHLPPNHWLDLKAAVVKRFSLPFSERLLPIKDVIEENCFLMTNIMLAANQRFNLVPACTAGWDSRLLLASCRPFAKDAYFYIFQSNNMPDTHIDVRIPKQMCRLLGVPFHVEKQTYVPDEQFLSAYMHNTLVPRTATIPVIYHQYKEFSDRVNVSENSISIVKMCFRHLGKTNAKGLAKAYHQPEYPFLMDWMQTWLDSAYPAFPNDRMDISELYFWEFYLANLTSTAATEQDIALEDLNPSNCRKLLLNCFAVHPDYHTEPHSYVFHRKMISLMWKELLAFPFNPDPKNTFVYFMRKHNLHFRFMDLYSSAKKSLRQLRHA
jgi:hypothetical protein